MENTKISVCIPNYNYASYMNETLRSLDEQTDKAFQTVISDNCSTDHSVEVISTWQEKMHDLSYTVNKQNVGFAGNLDRAAALASGDYMVMLSSDDIVLPEAIASYKKIISAIQQRNPSEKFFFGGQPTMIDSDGRFISELPKGPNLWFETDYCEETSKTTGFKTYRVASREMLKRCLLHFKTPLHFITICYPAALYQQVEGYGGGRLYNPDKWFNWKLLASSDFVYYIDKPMFLYRWHANNQSAVQTRSAVLRFWLDEYRNCFEVTPAMLQKAGISESELKNAFISRSVLAYTYSNIKSGNYVLARRILHFGHATYPDELKSNRHYLTCKILLAAPALSKQLLKLFNKWIP
jgi:glycosyltransferase involved in cell wall biosynthesis